MRTPERLCPPRDQELSDRTVALFGHTQFSTRVAIVRSPDGPHLLDRGLSAARYRCSGYPISPTNRAVAFPPRDRGRPALFAAPNFPHSNPALSFDGRLRQHGSSVRDTLLELQSCALLNGILRLAAIVPAVRKRRSRYPISPTAKSFRNQCQLWRSPKRLHIRASLRGDKDHDRQDQPGPV